MRIVGKPAFRPQHCAAIPFIGPSGHPDERWIDTGNQLAAPDSHVYLSETAIHEAAVLLGYPTPQDHAKLASELSDSLQALDEAYDELAALSKYKAAVDEIRGERA